MPSDIFFFRDAQGRCPVEEFLHGLDHKELARSLSRIDLLEGDDLPAEMDRAIDGSATLRALSHRAGRSRYHFLYVQKGDQTVLLDAVQGRRAKAHDRAETEAIFNAVEEIDHGGRAIPAERLKSHREYVAEMTLSDPTLAALYSRAREHAQFAISLIRLRERAGFTQDSLAERTGLSRARVDSLERGRIPKLTTLRRLVDSLQARIIISPGSGLSIEPYVTEPRRPTRPRRIAAVSVSGAPNLTVSKV